MLTDLNYKEIPKNFAFCLQNGCKRAEECMRRQAAECLTDAATTVMIINPHHAMTDGECLHFKAIKSELFAVGMMNMLNALPYETAKKIKKALICHYGNGNFYRMRDGTKHISPKEQAYVKSVFVSCGEAGEPQYDGFANHYIWQ